MDNNDPWLDRLRGDILETKLPKKLLPLVGSEFNVRRPRPVCPGRFAGMSGANLQFEDDLDAAADACKITEDEYVRLLATDLIIRALRNSDGATIWFAVEASAIIKTADIDHVRQSANAITKMYEQDAIPLVCGYRIPNPQRQQAREQRVHVIHNPRRRLATYISVAASAVINKADIDRPPQSAVAIIKMYAMTPYPLCTATTCIEFVQPDTCDAIPLSVRLPHTQPAT